ncbi:MAG: hypothetical protein U5K75_12090 [Ahrensia sp.]|nr:hypothetical protein [Ahrensia sp.]
MPVTNLQVNVANVRLCSMLQVPFAGIGDGKNDQQENYVDHGPIRVANARYFSATQNRFSSLVVGGQTIMMIQAIVRLNTDLTSATNPDIRMTYAFNESVGAMMAQVGQARWRGRC